ncbi:hypothetical protein L9F63_027545 [Diploptera punctata]|uniref:Uncharacterized protein n=1 Tax=Diploptera punctata TaxID=6984 RepID=A0AAD8A7A3_DIPPU|nr:hypothetical protein L9F63_027545 [Diploptera punctata]
MEDEERQKKVEAGKEKFAAYLKKKNASAQQIEQKRRRRNDEDEENSISKESSCENTGSIQLDVSCRSNGSSEDENRLRTRVKELEEILSGKEAAIQAAHEELFCLQTDYKTRLQEYHNRKLYEAVQDRERIIEQLRSSLQQTRDDLQLQGDHLAQEVALLQNQLKTTTESIQSDAWNTGIQPHEFLALQNKMLALEAAINNRDTLIEELRNVIREKELALHNKNEEVDKKCQEMSQHKIKSANEVQKLMREVEELHQKCAVQTSSHNSMLLEHEGQMASLQSELEENFGLQLVQIKE